ncbi:uncharacterized protein HKW66_Vig0152050 [Vigna angularis]|uniref:Methyltransferase FkbM domain-containing protein n=1 Tax=Phaseolus angularis TaxID=3914 RepID=A0A8T0JTL4_PHAAN|nr:uncharacterized protein HKW66_Vig0152050 [Vigna angularis]
MAKIVAAAKGLSFMVVEVKDFKIWLQGTAVGRKGWLAMTVEVTTGEARMNYANMGENHLRRALQFLQEDRFEDALREMEEANRLLFMAQNNPPPPHIIIQAVSPFDCSASPQAHPVFANTIEGLCYPFLFSLSDFGTLPNKPHKNIVRMLKGKPFRKPNISITIQDLLDEAKSKGKDGLVVNVGANVGMATFAASTMGFQVLAFEPVLKNLQNICERIYFNRVADLVTVFEVAVSDRVGNITVYKEKNKMKSRSSIESDGSTEVGTWKDESEFFKLAGMEEFGARY